MRGSGTVSTALSGLCLFAAWKTVALTVALSTLVEADDNEYVTPLSAATLGSDPAAPLSCAASARRLLTRAALLRAIDLPLTPACTCVPPDCSPMDKGASQRNPPTVRVPIGCNGWGQFWLELRVAPRWIRLSAAFVWR